MRISILSALMFMLAVAIGSRNCMLHYKRLEEFFFGMVAAYIAVGLVQQIFFCWKSSQLRSEGIAKILFLAFLLFGMGWGCYRSVVPYQLEAPAGYQISQLSLSTIAAPVWFFSVLLGSFTSPWMQRNRNNTSSILSTTWRIGVGLTLLAFFIFLILLWTIIPVITQIAINSVSLDLKQPAAMQSGVPVQSYGPSVRQLTQFTRMQIVSWPSILIAIALLVSYSRVNVSFLHQRRWIACSAFLGFLGLLLLPFYNVFWLLNGAAHAIAPQFVESYFDEPRRDIYLGMFLIVLISIYLAIPYGHIEEDHQIEEVQIEEPRWCWNDSWMVGICLVATGTILVFKSVRYINLHPSSLVEFLANPIQNFQFIALPAGCSWLWLKYRKPEKQRNRWPNIKRKHLLAIPLLALLLFVAIASAFPFGFAFAIYCR